MDVFCGCVEIFRYVLCCEEKDPLQTNWNHSYTYSQLRDFSSDPQIPSTTQSNVSKPTRNTTTNTRQLNVSNKPSSSSSAKHSSSVNPPPVTAKSTQTTLLGKLSEVSHKASEASPKPKGSISYLSASQKQSEVFTKPRDVISSSSSVTAKTTPTTVLGKLDLVYSSPISLKASEASPKPRESISCLSASQKQSEVSPKPRDVISSSSVTAKSTPCTILGKPSCQSSCVLPNIKTNTTGEHKSATQKCSHQISLPSSQSSSRDKLPLLNTTKPPPSPSPSSKPISSLSSPAQNKLVLSSKPAMVMDSSYPQNHNGKTNYIWVKKGASPTYATPDDIKGLIERDIVPQVLKTPLSISTYKEYFRALLYAEDYYLEKWDGFEMKNVTLELHDASIYKRRIRHNSFDEDDQKEEKTFVAFELDKVPERRPFLLSRDFVSLRPSNKNHQLFEGLVYRVVKSNLLLSEFGQDFLSQHRRACKYDVKFSFNRVCLKRAHQAIESASGPLFRNFLFPEFIPENRLLSKRSFAYDWERHSLIDKILRLRTSPPYLVMGQTSVTATTTFVNGTRIKKLTETGDLIVDAVVELCRTSPSNRVLLCAPANITCDSILRGLERKHIPEHDVFRANAAFRERGQVPPDIIDYCKYEHETRCFSCPSLDTLCRYKVILSTFMSSYRLHNEGLRAGHFSHIILVDTSSVTEPEALVPLANFAVEGTVAVVFGEESDQSGWVRSSMARKFGLTQSYFGRLCDSKLYINRDPNLIAVLNYD